jgi:23S rRNA pseudouridine2605 synthase
MSMTSQQPSGLIRLNRYLARAGVCSSRRAADALIASGQVRINGTIASLGTRVGPDDIVEVNGRRVVPQTEALYILLHKPHDTITTCHDERGRKTVLDCITLPPAQKQGLFPVGRLDRSTTGVLLLTNDGELAHRLMHPRYRIEKIYVARTARVITPHEAALLRQGVLLEDGLARAERVAINPEDPHEIALMLYEGRNRQVRRMLEALGHEVIQLKRTHYAGLTTAGVRPGKWRRLTEDEVRRLYRMVGLTPPKVFKPLPSHGTADARHAR